MKIRYSLYRSNHFVFPELLDVVNTSTTIQDVIVQEGTGDGMGGLLFTYTEKINVVPQIKYYIKLEVLMNDLGASNEKVSDIVFNGISIGECNPDCGIMTEPECDYACIFYDCTPFLTSNTISSATESLDVKLTYQGHSKDCDCNTSTWQCQIEDTDPRLTPILALARITLTPSDEGKHVNLI